MALPIAPTLPSATPAPGGAPAPAEPSGADSGFADLLKGEAARRAPAGTTRADAGVAADEARNEAASDATENDGDPAVPQATGIDPALAQWLAGLHMPPPAQARTPVPAAGAADDAADTATPSTPSTPSTLSAVPARTSARGAAAAAFERPGAEPRGTGRELGKALPAAPAAAGEEAPQAAAAASTALPPPKAAAFELPALAAPAAPAVAPAAGAPAAPVDVHLPLAPDAAGFGEAFATQVSVLARDGVQQAELHLNPAETGPVSIQIVMDGLQARIDFGADALPTRQAIEQSLPELAAALREQGLTLSGGGVSEHSRGRAPQPEAADDGGPARRGSDPRPAAPAARSVHIARSAGGVDLYA